LRKFLLKPEEVAYAPEFLNVDEVSVSGVCLKRQEEVQK